MCSQFCSEHPLAYLLFVCRAIVIYLGVLCFVTTIKHFGVVPATTGLPLQVFARVTACLCVAVTTVRKVLSILVSFLLFPKPFGLKYAIGLLLFAGSVLFNIYTAKYASNAEQKSNEKC